MASERKHFVRVHRPAVRLAALLKWTEMRNRPSDGWGNGVQGMTRSFAHEFEATTDLKLGEQRRDVKFHGAFGEIQFVGDFLVGKTAKDVRPFRELGAAGTITR
jgi:hypothetical protein